MRYGDRRFAPPAVSPRPPLPSKPKAAERQFLDGSLREPFLSTGIAVSQEGAGRGMKAEGKGSYL